MGQVQVCCDSASDWLSEQKADYAGPEIRIVGKLLEEETAAVTVGCRFRARLNKVTSDRLGIDIEHVQDTATLPIVAIAGGAAEKWNLANPQRILRSGDAIVEVNGHKGDAAEMLAACKRDPIVDVTVQRGAFPALARHQDDMKDRESTQKRFCHSLEERHVPCSSCIVA